MTSAGRTFSEEHGWAGWMNGLRALHARAWLRARQEDAVSLDGKRRRAPMDRRPVKPTTEGAYR